MAAMGQRTMYFETAASRDRRKAKLQKLAMDPRCAPTEVFIQRHPSDQMASSSSVDTGGQARLSPHRDFHVQKSLNPLRVPTDDGLGPDDYQGVAPAIFHRQDRLDPENPI